MIRSFSPEIGASTFDVCVVGAGPVGISAALELARCGRSVLLLESGGMKPNAAAQDLAEARIRAPEHHSPMALAVQRSLGGTSNLWGGRCVPLDAIDFTPRAAAPDSGWPLAAPDIIPHLPAACAYLQCGAARFVAPVAALATENPDFQFDRLERWSRQPRFATAYRDVLRDSRSITLVLNATLTRFAFADDGRVDWALVRGPDGAVGPVRARGFVLAAGGLENARLLLASQGEAGERFGGPDGALGRYYMGHIYGSIAEITIASEALDRALDYFVDGFGSYVRRRFTPSAELQEREGLLNISMWPEFPPIHDPSHHNSVLSLGYLVLSAPPLGRLLVAEAIRLSHIGANVAAETNRLPHLINVVRGLPAAARFFPPFLYRRYFGRPRLPGFFQRSPNRHYAISYHAEHAPHRESRVTLTGSRDATGLPRLDIDLRFCDSDAESILRAHQCFAEWLARTGLGRLAWSFPETDRKAAILRQATDGHHQIGTTRMAASPRNGVVDRDCRVFDAANLFVAGSSVFPSSSQANPTLTAVALAVRLARRVAEEAAQAEAPRSAAAMRRSTVALAG